MAVGFILLKITTKLNLNLIQVNFLNKSLDLYANYTVDGNKNIRPNFVQYFSLGPNICKNVIVKLTREAV